MLGTPKEHLATREVSARLTFEQVQALHHVQARVHDSLKAGDTERTAGRLMALLAHYFITPLPEKLHSAVFSDWLFLLAPYPNWAIEKACTHWLKTQNRKPAPRDIIQLSREEIVPFQRLSAGIHLLLDAAENRSRCASSPSTQ